MICYASALASLAEAIHDQGLSTPTYPRLGFITGAEKLYSSQRDLIERVFDKPVFERYGGRDIGMIGMQLEPQRSHAYSVDWPNVYLEREHPKNQSSMLVTKLHADAMPLFRYRTGDIGGFADDSPRIGPMFRIDEVVGRELQRVWRRDGTWMHGTVIPHLLKDFDLLEYQLRQDDRYVTQLLIVPRPAYNDEQGVRILRALEQNLPGINVEIVKVDAVPRTGAGKWLPVVSLVKP